MLGGGNGAIRVGLQRVHKEALGMQLKNQGVSFGAWGNVVWYLSFTLNLVLSSHLRLASERTTTYQRATSHIQCNLNMLVKAQKPWIGGEMATADCSSQRSNVDNCHPAGMLDSLGFFFRRRANPPGVYSRMPDRRRGPSQPKRYTNMRCACRLGISCILSLQCIVAAPRNVLQRTTSQGTRLRVGCSIANSQLEEISKLDS